MLLVAGHELTWDRRALAALLAAGPGGAVSHHTAARLLGFDGFAPGPIHVTVPRSRRPTLPPGARLHTIAALTPIDVVRIEPFTVTSGALDDHPPGGDVRADATDGGHRERGSGRVDVGDVPAPPVR